MATETALLTMTMESFHTSHEFLSLTPKQRVWIKSFIASQDARHATVAAYGAETTEEYRAMLTAKVESSPRVIAALDAFYQRSPRERFLRDLERDIKHSDGIAKVEAQKLFAKVAGFVSDSNAKPESQPVHIGDVVLVNGSKFRVTAIDANGSPTDGDPL